MLAVCAWKCWETTDKIIMTDLAEEYYREGKTTSKYHEKALELFNKAETKITKQANNLNKNNDYIHKQVIVIRQNRKHCD